MGIDRDVLAREQTEAQASSRDRATDDRADWRGRYARRLILTDTLALLWGVLGASFITVRPDESVVSGTSLDRFGVSYGVLALLLVGVWLGALAATGSRHHRRLGTGAAEYKRVLQSAVVVLIFIALASFALQAEFSRTFVAVALVAATAMLLLSRLLWRIWLRLHRVRGDFCARAVLVGSAEPVARIAEELRRHPEAGYFVVGAVVVGGGEGRTRAVDVPILRRSGHELLDAVDEAGADTVIVTDGHNLDPERLRELSWGLEPGRQHLVMAPSLTDIAGPRIHARPVAGLPLVHVETPRYEGADRFAKRAFDVAVSGGLLLAALLPLTVVAGLVLTTSRGGLFFSHERIGRRGEPFRMLKFRSMVPDADQRLAGLLAEQGTEGQPLFKIQDDPRVTPIGRFIRRYSIDEVPQLLNVLRGDMSLVGPRPQVAREVALYDDAASRRLFVKPGMTGLWQVSGRSNLDWEASLRLDLYYVENWSMTGDLAIMIRTVRAVLAKDGAY